MLNSSVSSAAPVAVQPMGVYFPWEWKPGRWAVLYYWEEGTAEVDGEQVDLCHLELHRGRRTGRPVMFSRLSDAQRLCRVLNGEEPASV